MDWNNALLITACATGAFNTFLLLKRKDLAMPKTISGLLQAIHEETDRAYYNAADLALAYKANTDRIAELEARPEVDTSNLYSLSDEEVAQLADVKDRQMQIQLLLSSLLQPNGSPSGNVTNPQTVGAVYAPVIAKAAK